MYSNKSITRAHEFISLFSCTFKLSFILNINTNLVFILTFSGYAFELARRGFKIGLIARNKEKLESVAQEIREKYNVDTKIVVFDFNTHYTNEKIKELTELLDVFDKISIFINNVGCASLDPLEKMADENIHKQINVIAVGTTVITKIIIQKLQLNNTKAALVFVGDNTYERGHPNLAVYSASKRYNN